jgi:hypothetical protein
MEQLNSNTAIPDQHLSSPHLDLHLARRIRRCNGHTSPVGELPKI